MPSEPIPMVLYCPFCGVQHVDTPEPDRGWTNPPHRSHLCHSCENVWRPADVPTTGVRAVATSGTADSRIPAAPHPIGTRARVDELTPGVASSLRYAAAHGHSAGERVEIRMWREWAPALLDAITEALDAARLDGATAMQGAALTACADVTAAYLAKNGGGGSYCNGVSRVSEIVFAIDPAAIVVTPEPTPAGCVHSAGDRDEDSRG